MSIIELEMNGNDFFNSSAYNVNILKCSQEHCHPQKAPEKRVRSYYSLHFVTHGCGVLKTGSCQQVIGQGNAFLLYAGEQYVYYPDKSDPWSYIWVDLTGEQLDKLFAMCGFSMDKPFIKLQKFAEITYNLKLLVDAYDASDIQQILCSGYFLIVLSSLIDNTRQALSRYNSHSVKFRHIRETLIYINNNYRLNLTIEEIAANVHISSSYLLNLFSEEIGISPIQYLNMYRVAAACELLKMPDMRVSEVAQMVGYVDPLYFSRVFSKIKGCSPREYAKQNINENPFEFLKEKNIDFR